MNVSVTERATYKRCRRAWTINSRNRWGMTKIVSPTALAMGTLVHETLGLWLSMHAEYQRTGDQDMLLPPGGLGVLFLNHANGAINAAKEAYRAQVGTAIDVSELAPLMESVTLGHAMMLNYQSKWQQPIPPGFELIATEMHCAVPIPGTEHTQEWVWEPAADGEPNVPGTGWPKLVTYPDTRLHYLEGRLDGVLREANTGRLFTLEHKTYGMRPRKEVLFSNDQFLAYHWILLNIADDLHLPASQVAGVAYDGLWKRAAPPKIVDGHAGSISDLFSRRLITRPVQELIEFEQMLAMEVNEMANNPPIYHNRTSDGSCLWGCSDNQLCLSMSRGEDYAYTLRTQYKRKEDGPDILTRLAETQW